jgi:sphinganine-1-phosphate aldolase
MFHSDEEVTGITTTGGTDSISNAILCYKLWAREVKGITKPNLVVSHTAHLAFERACRYY